MVFRHPLNNEFIYLNAETGEPSVAISNLHEGPNQKLQVFCDFTVLSSDGATDIPIVGKWLMCDVSGLGLTLKSNPYRGGIGLITPPEIDGFVVGKRIVANVTDFWSEITLNANGSSTTYGTQSAVSTLDDTTTIRIGHNSALTKYATMRLYELIILLDDVVLLHYRPKGTDPAKTLVDISGNNNSLVMTNEGVLGKDYYEIGLVGTTGVY